MLYSIFSLLLDVVTGLLGGACLLRLYMQWLRVPFGNPLGQFVLSLSNWLVLPLRRVLGQHSGLDWASLLAAFLLECAQFGLLWLVSGMAGGLAGSVSIVPLLALFGVARLVISGLSGLVIVYAVMSWVQTNTVLTYTVERLCLPLLKPIRRMLPLIGGIDLSPLVLLVGLQIAAMVLGSLQMSALR